MRTCKIGDRARSKPYGERYLVPWHVCCQSNTQSGSENYGLLIFSTELNEDREN